MHRVDIIRTTVGIIGNIISALLFLSPAPTFWRICKKKTTEEFHPYPYLASMMNCILWIFYGLPIVHPDSTLVVTINGFGLVMEIIFLSIFFAYTNKNYRKVIGLYLLAEIAIAAVIVVVSLLCFHTHTKRSLIVGIICDIFGIIMYASPLSIVVKVIKTKSAEFLPVWLCLAGFSNGIVWFSYAFLKTFDPYLATGNGIGAIFGFIQLSVWGYYTVWGRKEAPEKYNDLKPGEVQLQNYKNTPQQV